MSLKTVKVGTFFKPPDICILAAAADAPAVSGHVSAPGRTGLELTKYNCDYLSLASSDLCPVSIYIKIYFCNHLNI